MRIFFCIIKQILSNLVLKWNSMYTIINVWFNRKFSLAARYFHLLYNYFNNHCIELTFNYFDDRKNFFQRFQLHGFETCILLKFLFLKTAIQKIDIVHGRYNLIHQKLTQNLGFLWKRKMLILLVNYSRKIASWNTFPLLF